MTTLSPLYDISDFLSSTTPSDVPFEGAVCWIWVGRRDADGYGWLPGRYGARDLAGPLAHRYAYAAFTGKAVPEGMTIDHRCQIRSCVNPAHLRVLTRSENTSDAWTRRRRRSTATHCIHGHALEGENLRIRPDGVRLCRTCEREYQRRYARARRNRSRT